MHHVRIFSFALVLLSTTWAFVLPVDQTHERHQEADPASANNTHESIYLPLSRRISVPLTGQTGIEPVLATKRTVYCGCGKKLNHADTDAAIANLKQQVTGFHLTRGHKPWSAINGSVVAFWCNYDLNSMLQVWKGTTEKAIGAINDACGTYIAGSVGGQNEYSFGYMKHEDGLDYCAKALSSSKDRC